MVFSMLPFHPASKAKYNIHQLTPNLPSITEFYPEVMRCLQCNSCSRACPQELPVIDIMGAAMRGDIATAADLSFDCIMCGLCATRCPAEIVQYYVAILARRLYAAHISPRSKHLQTRLQEIGKGLYDSELDKLTHLTAAELTSLYNAREIEKEAL
jgi:CO dehydrogenase/acetyl-CoA synthase alpha subunit